MWLMPMLIGFLLALGYGTTKNFLLVALSSNQDPATYRQMQNMEIQEKDVPKTHHERTEDRRSPTIKISSESNDKISNQEISYKKLPNKENLLAPPKQEIIKSKKKAKEVKETEEFQMISKKDDVYKKAELLFNAHNQIEILKSIPKR